MILIDKFKKNAPLVVLGFLISIFIILYFYQSIKRSDYEDIDECIFYELKNFSSNQNLPYVESYCKKLIAEKQEKLRLAEEERLRKEAEKQEKLRLAEEERLRKEAEKQEKLRLAEEERLRKEAEKQEKLRLAEEERLRKEAEKQEKLRLAEEERLRKEAEKQEKLRLAEEERLRKEAEKQEKLRLAEEERLRKEAEKQEKLRLAEEERLRKESEKQEKLRLAEEERLRKEAEKQEKLRLAEEERLGKEAEKQAEEIQEKNVELPIKTKENENETNIVMSIKQEEKKIENEYWIYDYSYDNESNSFSGELKFTLLSKELPFKENITLDDNSLIKERIIKNKDVIISSLERNNLKIHEIAPYLNYDHTIKGLEKLKLKTDVDYKSFFYDDSWQFSIKIVDGENINLKSKIFHSKEIIINGERRTFPGNCTGNMVGVLKATLVFIPEVKRYVRSNADFKSCKFGGTEQTLFKESFVLKDFYQFDDKGDL